MLRFNFLYLDFCSYCSFAGPFENIGIISWALASALTLASALQKSHFVLEVVILSFEVYYEVKHP